MFTALIFIAIVLLLGVLVGVGCARSRRDPSVFVGRHPRSVDAASASSVGHSRSPRTGSGQAAAARSPRATAPAVRPPSTPSTTTSSSGQSSFNPAATSFFVDSRGNRIAREHARHSSRGSRGGGAPHSPRTQRISHRPSQRRTVARHDSTATPPATIPLPPVAMLPAAASPGYGALPAPNFGYDTVVDDRRLPTIDNQYNFARLLRDGEGRTPYAAMPPPPPPTYAIIPPPQGAVSSLPTNYAPISPPPATHYAPISPPPATHYTPMSPPSSAVHNSRDIQLVMSDASATPTAEQLMAMHLAAQHEAVSLWLSDARLPAATRQRFRGLMEQRKANKRAAAK